jgi:uncharacterized protein (TIGR03437 family)
MLPVRAAAILLFFLAALFPAAAATFGTVTNITGGASDIVLDEGRQRLYLVNSTRNQVEVYSIPQRRFLNPILVEQLPLAAAMSRNGGVLYVTCHNSSSMVEINLDRLEVINRVSLPARPEGIAVGGDERVLISTVGTGANNTLNVLLIYNPEASGTNQAITPVPIAPPAPANPLLPPANLGRPALIPRSFLETSRDGRFIVGVNIPNTTARAVFVYEVASGTVLRSRTVQGVSSVISVAPDGSKFMAGLSLLDSATLTVLAQQNAANAPYPFAQGTNFNLQQNQGGSVFTPDGSLIYSAFNFTPVQNPPARPNVSQLMVNDPDNLLIQTAYQLPENAAGKMVLSSDGQNLYALSESGFISVPIGRASENPVAAADATVAMLVNDQCGTFESQRRATLTLRNIGRGRLTANAQVMQETGAGPGAIGGGGAGGGAPGGGVIIIVPGVPGQPGQPVQPPTLPGGGQTATNPNIAAIAPAVRTSIVPEGVNFEFTFNANAARSLGTATPTSLFLISSNEAINIPPAVRLYQNNRNSEATGEIVPVPVGLSANEGLVDMIPDNARQRLYIANSALNRVEVFDMRSQRVTASVKVGQLPRSLALSPDGLTLYVANTGGESISIVDLDTLQVVGRVRFPALPFNATTALATPSLITSTQRGPLVMMSNGTIWRVVGDEAVPRQFNTAVLAPNAQGQQILAAPRTMASTPNGEYALVLAGNGFAYLYDAMLDDFIQSRQVVTGNITGYYGPVSAGPRGQYYLVNGIVLNSSLTPVATSGAVPGGTANRPVAAVTGFGNSQFARFTQPVIANANAVVTDNGSVEIVDANTGQVLRSAPALERPLSTAVGNQRANINGRTMAIDPTGTTAFVLTTTGVSVVPLNVPPPTQRPVVSSGGVVNLASYTPTIAQGGLISIFGRNLGAQQVFSHLPLPTTLGNSCVTLNNRPLPLLLMSDGQINAQVPYDLAPGTYPLIVRALDRKTASVQTNVRVTKYAPAVFVDTQSMLPAILHPDGRPVSKENPARRDRTLTLYAAGLGPPKGSTIASGAASPASPLAVTDPVEVFFGDPTINGTEMIVEWSGFTPGYVGLYQINLRVPGARWRGENLPVYLRIGGVTSPVTGPAVPKVTVD